MENTLRMQDHPILRVDRARRARLSTPRARSPSLPIAAMSCEQQMLAFAGPLGLPVVNLLLFSASVYGRYLNQKAYGLAEGSVRTASFTLSS